MTLPINRRLFIKKSSKITLGICTAFHMYLPVVPDEIVQKNEIIDERKYLNEILYTQQEVDAWLAGKAFPFSKYHSEFGWLLNNAFFKDGIDNSISAYTYEGEDGERILSNYSEKLCRINTYGDSFTQCHQVSDHETWQEVLAAHIQEPIRNFGIGGWSVYQAYLRMLKEEKRKPAKYIIFNIYEDDHKRNLDAWRNIRVRKHPQHIEAPLPHVKVNLKENNIIECKNPCPTPESLYNLCDLDEAYKIFKDDFVLKIMVAHKNSKMKNTNQSYSNLMELIKTHGIITNIDNSETISEKTESFHTKAAIFSTKKIIEKIEEYAKQHNKKVLYVLSFSGKSIAKYINEKTRFDNEIIDFMRRINLFYVDLMEEHTKDFLQYRLDIKDYINKYFIGHYNPRGNFFCAYAIKDKMIEILDPKPFPYR